MARVSFAISRREFLVIAGAAMAATGTGLSLASMPANRLKNGVTLAWLAGDVMADLQGTLAKLANIGYKQVEAFDGLSQNPNKLRDLIGASGLQCESMLFWRQFESTRSDISTDFANDAELSRQIEFAHTLGVRYMVYAYVPFGRGQDKSSTIAATKKLTLDDYKREAEVFNKIGAQTQKAGLSFAYHNHNFEFRDFDGTLGYDELLRSSDPALVKMEMDVGWVVAAGQDPTRYFKQHPGRFCGLHVKDVKVRDPNLEFRLEPVEVGKGIINWRAVLAAAQKAGVRNGYVEYEAPEPPPRPGLESAKDCYEYLQTLTRQKSSS